jgi:hypothetical protein
MITILQVTTTHNSFLIKNYENHRLGFLPDNSSNNWTVDLSVTEVFSAKYVEMHTHH